MLSRFAVVLDFKIEVEQYLSGQIDASEFMGRIQSTTVHEVVRRMTEAERASKGIIYSDSKRGIL